MEKIPLQFVSQIQGMTDFKEWFKIGFMTIATDLDGIYSVNSVTDYDGPLQKKSDGQTEIKDGKTHRIDDAGCEWNSTFEWVDEERTQVKMTSVADPINADPDFLLTRPDGSPTSDAVTYETILNVKRKDEKVQMTGSINYGGHTVLLTMRKN
jgi:hypothetical protein